MRKTNKTLALSMALVSALLSQPVLSEVNGDNAEQLGNVPLSTIENPYIDKSVQPLERDAVNRTAKKEWMNEKMPLNPDDVDEYIKRSLEIESSFKSNVLNTELVRKTFSINPSKPFLFPKIIVATGFETIISFWDSSGAPWEIEYHTKGNEKGVAVSSPKEINTKNILSISPIGNLVKTNVTVSLVGLDRPIVLEVQTSDIDKKPIVYADISMQVQARSPKTKIEKPYMDNSFEKSSADDNVLLSFLDGIIPKDAVPVKVVKSAPTQSELWMYNDSYYLRTDAQLIWPPAQSINSGSVNTKVYRLTPTPIIKIADRESGDKIDLEVK